MRWRNEHERWMALASLLIAALAVAVMADSPGDHYPGGSTVRPPVYSGGRTNPAYTRTITVYGSVASNDVLIFIDNTGARGRGTNLLEAVTGWATNAVAADVAVARTNYQAAVDAEATARAAGDAVARTNYQAAVDAEAVLRAAGDAVARTNYQAAVDAEVAARAGYSNHVRQVYLRGVDAGGGVWELYIGD